MNTEKQKEILALLESGKYFATKSGTVGSRTRGYEIILSAADTRNGYKLVTLMGRRRITVLVHQVVLLFFKGPYPENLTVNHRDGKKRNNRPSNLEICSLREQQAHAFRKGLRTRRLTDEKIREARRLRKNKGLTWRALALKFGMSDAGIRKVVGKC